MLLSSNSAILSKEYCEIWGYYSMWSCQSSDIYQPFESAQLQGGGTAYLVGMGRKLTIFLSSSFSCIMIARPLVYGIMEQGSCLWIRCSLCRMEFLKSGSNDGKPDDVVLANKSHPKCCGLSQLSEYLHSLVYVIFGAWIELDLPSASIPPAFINRIDVWQRWSSSRYFS
jgi:hypothetical protein